MTKSTRELPALAATPAVGVETLRYAAQKVLDGLHHRMDRAGRAKIPIPVFEGIAELASALAQPASPLRGREWSLAIEEAARCVDIHAQEMRNCSLTLTPDGLSSIAKAIRAFAASPPEQPAADKEAK